VNVIIFFYIFYKLVDSVARLKKILLVSCLGNGLYSAFAVVTGSLGSGRLAFGGMFDPNDLAFFALAFLPLNLLFISRDNSLRVRLACMTSLGFGILLILLTGSRAGLLAFGLAAAILLLSKTCTVGGSQKVILVSMCIVFASISQVNVNRYKTLFNVENDYNVVSETGRLAIWDIGLRAFLTHPLTGVGVNCFNEAVGRDRQARGLEIQSWQTAHNSIVQIGTETGIFGLVLFLLMSLNVWRIYRRIRRSGEDDELVKIAEMGAVAFTGLFVSGMFLSQAYSFYWAFHVALSAVVNQLLVRRERIIAVPES
jgi:O-antigen ligase